MISGRTLLFILLNLGAIILPEGLWGADRLLRVLFIGNSYTYFNNAPEIFSELARTQAPGLRIEVGMVTVPGETLVSMWQRSNAREVLSSSKWDYVVLQCQSQLGDGLREGKFVVNSPTLLHWGVRLFDAEIKRQGARTVLFLTWSRKTEPEQQADLNYAYDSVARELGAILAPVGPAWQEARAQRPDLELYAKDGSHPSSLGSYLLACVLVHSILPNRNRELPSEIIGHPIDSSGNVDTNTRKALVSAPVEDARILQTIAMSTVRKLKDRGGYLAAPKPVQQESAEQKSSLRGGERFDGQWTGELNYFPSPAGLALTLRIDAAKCEGDVVITLPERRQQYESPITGCSTDGNQLNFSVVMLPIPFLVDRFSGQLSEGRLFGKVQRTGRELTNSMTGSWSLRRVAQ
jgi:hypothetical protein